MHNRLAKLREKRENGENGFTLIELLVVVVIIGILIAIAIPLYLNYKKGAADKASASDLRGAVNVLEQCNSDNATYPISLAAGGGSPGGCTAQTVNTSSGTVFKYIPSAATAPVSGYILTAYNINGNTSTTNYYCYSSANGGQVTTTTKTYPTAWAAGYVC